MKFMSNFLLVFCLTFAYCHPGYAAPTSKATELTTQASNPFWLENFIPFGVASYSRGDYVTGTAVAAADVAALSLLYQGASIAISIANEGDNGYGGLGMIGALMWGTILYGSGRVIGLGGNAIHENLRKQNHLTSHHPTGHNSKDHFSEVPTFLSLSF